MKKGISNVLSSVLILAISISVISIYAQWAPNFSEGIAQDAANQTSDKIRCNNVAFSVRNAEYDKSGDITIFELENEGNINLYNEVNVVTVNNSEVIGNTTVESLEVGEAIQVNVESTRIPEYIFASSKECPSVAEKETFIEVHP